MDIIFTFLFKAIFLVALGRAIYLRNFTDDDYDYKDLHIKICFVIAIVAAVVEIIRLIFF